MATILVSLHFLIIFYVSNIPLAFAQNENQFIYNGFHPAKLHLDGTAQLLSNGLLQLTNIKNISSPQVGHVFYQFPLKFNTTSSGSTLSLSFSTNFVFAIVPQVPSSGGGHGMTFTISPSWNFIQAGGNQYLGLFNTSNDGLPVNHILAIELDTILNPEFGDIDRNHVGIDVNSLNSTELAPAMYFSNKEGKNISLELTSGNPMHLWIDYDEAEKLLNVTLAPTRIPKPNWPLISKPIDLSQYLLESMYVGFSATTGTRAPSDHYILGWSFNKSGQAQSLDVSKLPSLP
nr:putative l-type lectin-domain containing receptor kinase i.11 [Quercus suber]